MVISDVKNIVLDQLNNFYTTTTLNRKILKMSLLRILKIRLVGSIPLFLVPEFQNYYAHGRKDYLIEGVFFFGLVLEPPQKHKEKDALNKK